MGTVGFAAPEQFNKGSRYDLRSDIFSFGRTFYNLVTGIIPPKGVDSVPKPVRSINSSISVGLEQFINKCMELNPANRFQSFSEVIVGLDNIDKKSGYYKTKQWLKVVVSCIFLVGFISFGVLGVIGKFTENTALENGYINALEVANKTGKPNDWSKAINIFPLRINPYFQMVEDIKDDGIFDEKEEKILLNTISPNIQKLSEDNKYKDLTFEIGKLYWFYRAGAIEAGKWLYDSIENNETAKVLFQLTEFNKNLKSAVLESSDNGMYEEYYKNLSQAMRIDGGEILYLASRSAFVDCVSFYSNKLKRDGVTKEDLVNTLNSIKTEVSGIKPETKTAKGYLSNINSKIEGAFRAIEVSYGN